MRTRRPILSAAVLGTVLAVSACSGAPEPGSEGAAAPSAPDRSWDEVLAEADGQTVDLWMYGGDQQGNTYVDDVLAPAAAELGVTLRRVPVADTADALNRVLSELQAGEDDGSVDLVWVNGENFATGRQADAWLCGWTAQLPAMEFVDPEDPLLTSDFGTPVDGCEAPWHKAQFVLAYDSADVTDPPASMTELFDWIEANPGRFTYPAPPDFTGSAFLRQALYAVAGGPDEVPAEFDQAAFDEVAPQLFERLSGLAPSLWRAGETYPRDLAALEELYAGDQVDMTMTYGPATLAQQVASGALPESTRVLPLDGGTLGNASFLAVPANAGDQAGALVVADLALSPEQQLAKADPAAWGQYPVVDLDRVPADVRSAFEALPSSPAVPPFAELSRDADPELGAGWVAPLEDGWRTDVLGG
ncbi:ABC transporter substrate-binding protein [Geodermatophilus sp. SYSU D01106]